jgi:hypothetical protein
MYQEFIDWESDDTCQKIYEIICGESFSEFWLELPDDSEEFRVIFEFLAFLESDGYVITTESSMNMIKIKPINKVKKEKAR